MRVLAVNVGSTSVKVSLLDGDRLAGRWDELDAALAQATDVHAVAHRVVHGGERDAPALVDDALVAELAALGELAPLHQPPAIDAIEACRRARPSVPQVACFDTAFHRTIPPAAATYALPAPWRAQVRVFGFHGLSHAWSAAQVAAIAPEVRRLVVAHLGGGQSLCAVLDGRSAHTTMGFTPLDGLVMGTRVGAIDPGAVLWLRQRVPDLDQVFERESGLVGLCGTSDLRAVERRRDAGDPDAALAFDIWRHRAISQLGACIAVLGGVDALAFTGGIGEHDGTARRALLEGLDWAGIGPCQEAIERAPGVTQLSAEPDPVRVLVVESREDLQMAHETALLLAPTG